MPEGSTTPDLVELVREMWAGVSRRDLDAVGSLFAPDAIWDTMLIDGHLEGVAAMAKFNTDWLGGYEQFEIEAEEVRAIGKGVTFAVVSMSGMPVGSNASVRQRFASVMVWSGGVIVRVKDYTDIDEARAAAERLAEERE